MRVALITGSLTASPVMQWLMQQKFLCGVVIQHDLQVVNPQIQDWLNSNGVSNLVVQKQDLLISLKSWLLNIQADLVIVFGFSWIIPQQLFKYATYGFYNIHFSLLPFYKGPAPLFWQLKNGEKQTGISIHRMSKETDAGLVVMQVPVPIIDGEYMGFLHTRLSLLTNSVLTHFFEQKAFLMEKSVVESITQSSYQKRPTPSDLRINWQTMDAKTIIALVQAANPVYGGAVCVFREQELRLVEVTRVGRNDKLKETEKKGGLILIAANEVGIDVLCCCGERIAIKVVTTVAGTMSADLWQQLQQVKGQEILF